MLRQEDHPKIRASENPTMDLLGGKETIHWIDFTPEFQTIKKQTAAKGTRKATNSQLVGEFKMKFVGFFPIK